MPTLNLDTIKALIKSHGLRVTSPRVAVLNAISQRPHPLSHSQLLELLDTNTFDDATVYRNLVRLTEVGILQIVSRAGGMARYELSPSHEHSHPQHPHFVCDKCERVLCLPDDIVTPQTSNQSWKNALSTARIQLSGNCPDCLIETSAQVP